MLSDFVKRNFSPLGVGWRQTALVLFLLISTANADAYAPCPTNPATAQPSSDRTSKKITHRFLVYRRYLRIPICQTTAAQTFQITAGDDQVFKRTDLRLAEKPEDISSWVEIDVDRWIGATLTFETTSEKDVSGEKMFSLTRQTNSPLDDGKNENECAEETADAKVQEKISFASQIQPILAEKCYACHGPDGQNEESNLKLSDRESAIDYDALVPGQSAESSVIARILSSNVDTVMPPPEAHKAPVTDQERDLLERWIDQGAHYETHWSFAPLVAPKVQTTANGENTKSSARSTNFTRNNIDAFILRKLKENNLTPNPDSDPARLVRRLAFDLTGLPPNIDLVESFVKDSSDTNWTRIVDQLLDSPHYGEHWARHWLDAVRYGDTHGIHIDNSRSIWPYRDWVVNSINQNMAFDQFTIEQIAGDMLPDSDVSQKVASGYNRCLPTTSEVGRCWLRRRMFSCGWSTMHVIARSRRR